MLDLTVDTSKLNESLAPYMNAENKKRISVHLRLFKQILLEAPSQRPYCLLLLQHGASALLNQPYWLSLEVHANELPHDDDVVYRRCLYHFAKTINPIITRPSIATVYDTEIDILSWHRKSAKLGSDLASALSAWDRSATVADETRRATAQKALQYLKMLAETWLEVKAGLYHYGLAWFGSLANFRLLLAENPVQDKHQVRQSALAAVLGAFDPGKFTPVTVQINHKRVDVTDLAERSPNIANQLQAVANMSKFKGEKDHDITSVTRRYIACISSLRKVFEAFPEQPGCIGLPAFKTDQYQLVTKAKTVLSRYAFAELVLLLECFFEHPIHRHDYLPGLLPFYFEKQQKFRTVDFSTIAEKFPVLFAELKDLHRAEIDLLSEKNYSMETLHTRFNKLIRLLNRYLLTHYKAEFSTMGLRALSQNENEIQRSLFQSIQGDVQSKKISRRTGTSYFEVVRWIMMLTDQPVVEAFKISLKRHQTHARRLRIEDLYTDDELRELAFYVEKGIRLAANEKQLVTLYFARIQLKTCWNTAPMADIELDDIKQITLPTAKKAVNVLIQKPRKGYDIDCYSMDGRTLNSVMRDIQFLRDEITAKSRYENSNCRLHRYLFIYQEWTDVFRLNPSSVSAHISSIIERLGCRITYNSMRIRKTGANHLYREVAKSMRSYQDIKLHTFDTFIKHYQRIEESKTQDNLHDAVAVMQKYFTGREIDPSIRIITGEDCSLQKTPTGECASRGNDTEALQYHKEHRKLKTHSSSQNLWCGDYLACIWCKHFRTVADAEHVWQLLSYRDYVLADMTASMSHIENNEFQCTAFEALQSRVDDILEHISLKSSQALAEGETLLKEKGMHPFWSFAITSVNSVDGDHL